MASKELALEGLTTFRSFPGASFRFMLTLKNGKLNVWLENCKSKKQWQSGYIGLDAFVSPENAIPGAELTNYAECFKTALEKNCAEEEAPVERELREDDTNGLKLVFVVHLKVFDALWSPSYFLPLEPILVDQVDKLESRLFDVERSIERNIAKKSKTSVAQLSVATSSTPCQPVNWVLLGGDIVAVEHLSEISVLTAGTYLVLMHIFHKVSMYGTQIQLRKNGKLIFNSIVAYNGGYESTTDATSVVHLERGDKLSLMGWKLSLQAGSTITFAELFV